MNSKDLQGLYEAYYKINDDSQNLNEYSAFLGGKIGGGERSVTVGGSAGGFGGSATFGTRRGKDTDAAAKASITNAVADVQNKQRDSDIASRNSATTAAKPTASPAIKPGAKGAAALGGGLSLSSAQKTAVDANRAPVPTVAAKVSEPETKNTRFATANVSGSAGGTQKQQRPTVSRPDGAKSKTPQTGSRPTPAPTSSRPTPTPAPTPSRQEFSRPTPTPSRPEPSRPEPSRQEFSRPEPVRRMPMPSGVREEVAYYLLLNYLIGEGYASTEEAADKIILNMSESWYSSIMEEVGLGK